MGCIHGSIKFVCIDHGVTPPGNKMVKVCTLDLDRREWNEDKSLTCHWEEFWTKACTMNTKFKHLQRPLHPQYPVLMPDGALCLLLPKTRHKPGVRVKKPDYICFFDMCSKSCLCFGHIHNYHFFDHFILPSDFFKDCCPARRKRKPPTLKRKPPAIIKYDPLMGRPAVAQVVPLPVVDAFFGKKYQRRKETVPTTNYR